VALGLSAWDEGFCTVVVDQPVRRAISSADRALAVVEFASGGRICFRQLNSLPGIGSRRWLVTGVRELIEEGRIGPFTPGAEEDSDDECGQTTRDEGDDPNPSAVPFPAEPGTPHPHRAGHKRTDGGKDGDPIGGSPR